MFAWDGISLGFVSTPIKGSRELVVPINGAGGKGDIIGSCEPLSEF